MLWSPLPVTFGSNQESNQVIIRLVRLSLQQWSKVDREQTVAVEKNYWVGTVKNGPDLLDRGTLKSSVSHKWFDELSRLIEWFVHVDFRDGIIIGLIANFFCIFDI